MKNKMNKQTLGLAVVAFTAAGLLLGGCAAKTYTPVKANFLSTYIHLRPVDDTTKRFVNTNRLAIYNKFRITSAMVMPIEFDGKPISAEQKEKASAFIREALTKALEPAYPIVSDTGPDVGQIRIAITSVYKTEGRLGLTVEGEVLDVSSGVQVAAVMKSSIGKLYLGDWWNSYSAKEIVDAWALRLRESIDIAHGVK
jgi:hypothetical protein